MDESRTTYSFDLIKRFDDDDTAQILRLDDFQVVFDPYNQQVRINLTVEQEQMLRSWRWRRAP